MPDKNELVGWLKDAMYCLLRYRQIQGDLGIHPKGMLGHSVEAVIEGTKKCIEGLSPAAIRADLTIGGYELREMYRRMKG